MTNRWLAEGQFGAAGGRAERLCYKYPCHEWLLASVTNPEATAGLRQLAQEPARLPRARATLLRTAATRESHRHGPQITRLQASKCAQALGAAALTRPPLPLACRRRTAAHPTTSCCHAHSKMEAASSPPGSEFYMERVRRAQAIPEAERSPEVATWLASHAAMKAAAAALTDIPYGQLLTLPVGGSEALAAVLQFVAHSFANVPVTLMLPNLHAGHLAPQLPPLMTVWCLHGSVCDRRQPLLTSILQSGLAGGAASLELVARLLLMASVYQQHAASDPALALDVMEVLEPALSGTAAETRLASELAQLQGQLSGSSSAAGSLPTVQQLQAARHNLSLCLLTWLDRPGKQQLDPDRVVRLAQRAAQGLATLQPNSPHSSLQLGKVAVCRRCAAAVVCFQPCCVLICVQ